MTAIHPELMTDVPILCDLAKTEVGQPKICPVPKIPKAFYEPDSRREWAHGQAPFNLIAFPGQRKGSLQDN